MDGDEYDSASIATTATSQVSNDDSDPGLSTQSSQSSRTSHACTFDIKFDTLRYRDQLLQDVQYRQRNKRALSSNAKISWIYQHGADLQARGYQKLWLCKACHLKNDYSSQLFDAKSTSSIAYHLDAVHGIGNRKSGKAASSRESAARSAAQHAHLPVPFNDREYKRDLVDFFIDCNISFFKIENVRARRVLIAGRPEIETILPTSHNTIKQWVLDAFQSRRVQIKEKLSLARSKINLSLDGWRAPNCDEYTAICAHFLQEDYKLAHCLLGFKKVYGKKSGYAIANITADVISDYEFSHNLGAFMMDNATDNDSALEELASRFDIDVDHARLRCLGHIINLVVKALLFGKGVSKFERQLAGASDDEAFKIWNSRGPIGKLHNICVYINRNSARQQIFREYQGGGHGDFQLLQLLGDGGIRWNSTEAMIARGMSLPMRSALP